MQRLILVATVFMMTSAATAQTPDRRVVGTTDLSVAVGRHESAVRRLAMAISRDAFLVSQLVHATSEFRDFQKSAAISKAIDRVNIAIKRANEIPIAAPEALGTLESIRGTLLNAQRQGATADFPSVHQEVLTKSRPIQRILFDELMTARRERAVLIDAQAKLGQLNQQLDTAMTEGLGSTLDFVRAGGK